MRILTVRQPWALHIIQSGKDVENRVRNVAGGYRGPVAIHAGLKPDEAFRLGLRDQAFEYGAIIGIVDLVAVHRTTGTPNPICYEIGGPDGLRDAIEAERGLCSPWAESGSSVWHLQLANPRKLIRSIPYRGALGLRTLDPETVALIERTGFITHERLEGRK